MGWRPSGAAIMKIIRKLNDRAHHPAGGTKRQGGPESWRTTATSWKPVRSSSKHGATLRQDESIVKPTSAEVTNHAES